MPNLLASDVVVQEESPAVRGIPSVATAVLGMLGVSLKGPTDQEVIANSYDEWERVFGGHIASSDASLAVKMFFEQGGTELHFVRVVHHTDASDPLTKASTTATKNLATDNIAATSGSVTSSNSGPWDLEPADNLSIAINGGGPAVATFNATAAARETTNAETFALANGNNITVKVDQGAVQTIAFLTAEFVAIASATAEEVAAVINAKIVGAKASVTSGGTKVTITSDKRGTGSHIEVTGGTGNGALAFATAEVNGTGNVANIDAVTFTEAKTIIEAAVAGCTVTNDAGKAKISSNTTGTGSSVLVQASSTADDEFGFDNATHSGSNAGVADTLQVDGKYDGTYGNNVSIVIEAATSGEAARFNLKVSYNGTVIETFPNLTMDATDARFVETVINAVGTGSAYIEVTDLEAVGLTTAQRRPVSGTFGPLVGGGDGLGSLADTDYNGGTGANGSVGLRCLDEVQNLTLLTVPGRATASVHNAMITYCEIVREGLCFAVLDPPRNLSATQMVTYVKTTAAIQRLSELAAIYWPNVLVDNPNRSVFGNTDTIVAPPSGAIAGLYARVDASRPSGVFQHPAGTELGKLFNVRGFEMPEVKKKAKREIVFPELINPISTEPGQPIFLDGARCLKDNANWPTIGERRGVIFIETSMKQGLAFMRHRNITDRLYNEGKKTALAFMVQQTRNEAFASTNPKEAFVLDFGKGLNPPSVKFARQVVARLSVATAAPGEFILLKVSPDRRALEAELAAAA